MWKIANSIPVLKEHETVGVFTVVYTAPTILAVYVINVIVTH